MKTLAPEIETELRYFEEEIAALESGASDPNDFKRFRLENGVYGIRNSADRHMIRIRIPFGRITPDQLEGVADIAQQFTPTGISHLTTRQDIQFHNVLRADVPKLLRLIAEMGLTTREACGNTVRNVTACPFAGVASDEAFDVTPYAEAVNGYFLRNPINQNLPRKFKIAFEGCAEDHARIPIHDIGAVAKVRSSDGKLERGFHIYVAGGLGAQPRSADRLEDFTPAELIIPTIEAAIRVFDRYGERRPERVHRMRARMKFIAREWGKERLHKAILSERKQILLTRSGRMPIEIDPSEETPPKKWVWVDGPAPRWLDPAYQRWLKTNVSEQKQRGWHVVAVAVPLGDITPASLRALAQIARRYADGRIRISIGQNFILRWVAAHELPHLFAALKNLGLVETEGQISDITRCPGADTCQLALTHSRGLAAALRDSIADRYADIPEVLKLSIKISGCMNSCGQHHIADVGLFGASLEVDGKTMPVYSILLGGQTVEGKATFGKFAAKVPARLTPDAVRSVLDFYVSARRPDEEFRELLQRVGIGRFRSLLQRYTQVSSYVGREDLQYDLGETEQFKAEIGVGECAS